VLTGQYAHNHGVLGNEPPDGGFRKLDSTNTLAVWLQRAGYHTAHLGKYLNHYGEADPTEVPPGWSDWNGSVDPSTYNFLNTTLNENGTLVSYRGQYQADVYAEKASEIVRRGAASGQPFFAWIAFTGPHAGGPREPDDPGSSGNGGTPAVADRHRDAFAFEPVPDVPSFNEADVSDKPRHDPLPGVKGSYRAPSRSSTCGGTSAIHSPTASSEVAPASTAHADNARTHTKACRTPRGSRGSGTSARRSSNPGRSAGAASG
jgi:arylsulfatase A-like enzyme